VALSDIYARVEPDEDPYHLAASLGFACEMLEEVDLFETARALWQSDRGDLMMSFVCGWLAAHEGTQGDRRAVVLGAVQAARLGASYVSDDDAELFTLAIDIAEQWALGQDVEETQVALARDLLKDRIDSYPEDVEPPVDALFGAYSAALLVERFSVVWKGEPETYAATAALLRTLTPPPAGSVWETF
jgi:hypothetical protein